MLAAARAGRRDALDQLLDAVYPAFRMLASNLLQGERDGHTMQTSDLVHETVIRLFLQQDVQMHDRMHLMALAGRKMRHILVEHARAKLAQCRGGGAFHQPIPRELEGETKEFEALLILDDLLAQLRTLDPRAAEVVELKFFAGFSRDEIAARLGVNARTVQRDWEAARAWLLDALGPGAA